MAHIPNETRSWRGRNDEAVRYRKLRRVEDAEKERVWPGTVFPVISRCRCPPTAGRASRYDSLSAAGLRGFAIDTAT